MPCSLYISTEFELSFNLCVIYIHVHELNFILFKSPKEDFGDLLGMAGVQEQLELKFRLHDGSDIGPKAYPAATSVATLKESILAEWPKGWLV